MHAWNWAWCQEENRFGWIIWLNIRNQWTNQLANQLANQPMIYQLTRGNAKWRSKVQITLWVSATIKNQSKLKTVLLLNSWAPATIKNQRELGTVFPLNSWAPATIKGQSELETVLPIRVRQLDLTSKDWVRPSKLTLVLSKCWQSRER